VELTMRQLVRMVVQVEAPEELTIFDRTSNLDDAAAVRRLTRRSRGRTLGFGGAEAVALVASVVWLSVRQAAGEFGTDAGRDAASGVRLLIRKLLRRKAAPERIPPFTPSQIELVRNQVYDSMKTAGFKESRAKAVADDVFRELSIRRQTPPENPSAAPKAASREDR
jgi:hypothetical protein